MREKNVNHTVMKPNVNCCYDGEVYGTETPSKATLRMGNLRFEFKVRSYLYLQIQSKRYLKGKGLACAKVL